MTPRIDAHQHFWRVARGDYGWLTPAVGPIYRDFGAADLAPLLKSAGNDATIIVQAAQTVAETHFMLDIAAQTEWVAGVVGWAQFDTPSASEDIGRLAEAPKLVGLRPMIQDIPDDDWMLRPSLDAAFRAVEANDLVFDALVFPRHLKNLLALLGRYPEPRVVIDHCAKPRIADGLIEPWAADMARLARETDAFCKLSGIVTEAAKTWGIDDLKPYVDHVLEHFGPDRIVWGSDWPVATLAATYPGWHATARTLTSHLSSAEQAGIFAATPYASTGWKNPAAWPASGNPQRPFPPMVRAEPQHERPKPKPCSGRQQTSSCITETNGPTAVSGLTEALS
jgi:L-fuconolactonase